MAILLCREHKSMQQIAILIIAILTYVQGIRYDGGNQNNNNNINNANFVQKQQRQQEQLLNNSNAFQPLYNSPFQPHQKQHQTSYEKMAFYGAENYPITKTKPTDNENNLIHVINAIQSSSSGNGDMARQSFRPSQVIDFTLNDATLQQQQQMEQNQQQQQQGQRQLADNNIFSNAYADKYMQKQQFKFPTNSQLQQQEQRDREQSERTESNNLVYYNYNNNNNNLNNNNNINQLKTIRGGGVTKAIPAQLQSTPILSYKDPYTNENYQYTTTSGSNAISHEPPSSVQLNLIQQYQPEQQPEEYIVGSSYYVGSDSNHTPNRGIVDFIYQKQTEQQQHQQQQPQLPDNKHYHQNHYRPQQPAYSSGLKTLQVLPSTEHNVVGERLSYDSHDYPPPSYAQSQTNLGGVVFNGGAIQPSPSHHKFPSVFQAPAIISNYANNFGNYLANGEQQDYTISTYQNTPGYESPPQVQSPSSLSSSTSSSRPPLSYESFNHYNNYYENDNNNNNNYNNKYTFSPQGTNPITFQQYQLQQQQQKQDDYLRPPQYGYGEPPRPVIPAPPPANGFPSLASFLSTTQEYAPQFTNLLLNGIGATGGGGGGDNPSKSPQIRPLRNMQLIKALENIARNDDLQCVPKVLCQMIAAQTQRGQLPAFITSPTITNFLSGFPVTSPMLIYGRAALLGLSGGDNGCTRSYLKCPKNEYEILYYLNNHRGGFFKFFSEPDDTAILQQQLNTNQNTESGGGVGGESSLFSIFSAITGLDSFTSRISTTTTTPRPPPPPHPPRPVSASLDSVGNFFTKVLSEYLNGVEYQRRRTKRSAITNENAVKMLAKPEIMETDAKQEMNLSSEENDEGNKKNEEFEKFENEYKSESRILHKNLRAYDEQTFFPQDKPHAIHPVHLENLTKYQGNRYSRLLKTKAHNQKNSKKLVDIVKKFNANRAQRKLKFPMEGVKKYEMGKSETTTEYDEDEQEGDDMNIEQQIVFLNDYEAETEMVPQQNQNVGFVNSLEDEVLRVPNGHKIVFKNDGDDINYNGDQHPHETQIDLYNLKEREHRNFIFPDQKYEQYLIRTGRILNRPTYASQYNEYHEDRNQNEFVLSGHKRQPHADRAILSSNVNSLHINQMSNSTYQNLHFSNTQNTVNSNNNFYANSYGATPTRIVTNKPTTNKYYSNGSSTSSNIHYNHYSQHQSTTHLTTKPPRRHKDDENIYVTNARGETEYYLTPGGRKVYLRNV